MMNSLTNETVILASCRGIDECLHGDTDVSLLQCILCEVYAIYESSCWEKFLNPFAALIDYCGTREYGTPYRIDDGS